MDRSIALRSLFAVAVGSAVFTSPFTGARAALAADAPTAPMAPKLAAPIAVITTDGKKGLLSPQSANGKTSYFLTLNGKAAAPGSYACANGTHITVTGPNGLVDATSTSRAMLNPQPLPP
jgi:hypothetical protein